MPGALLDRRGQRLGNVGGDAANVWYAGLPDGLKLCFDLTTGSGWSAGQQVPPQATAGIKIAGDRRLGNPPISRREKIGQALRSKIVERFQWQAIRQRTGALRGGT